MELWLDTIEKKTIERANKLGFLQGITTNPSILSKSNDQDLDIIKMLLSAQPGLVAIQLNDNFIEEGVKILELFPERVILKIPVTEEGLQAINYFSKKNALTMATVIYDSLQVYLAAKAGATYAALYLSRMQDEQIPAFDVLQEMVKIIHNYNFNTKILAASIRTLEQIRHCTALGVKAITLKESVFFEIIATHEHTASQLEQFKKDSLQKKERR